MRIRFTGVRSFPGYWFVKSLAQAGHHVVCPLTGGLDRFEGTRKERVTQLSSQCHLVPDAPFGSDAFLNLIGAGGPWVLLCHHGAFVPNYKSPQLSPLHPLQPNTQTLPSTLPLL